MLKLSQVLDQEMSRRQFLGVIGGLMASFFGISALLGLISNVTPKDNVEGYGIRNYGP